MARNLDAETIAAIKTAIGDGVMFKVIAKRFGVGVGTVGFHSKGIPRPFEHRGRKSTYAKSQVDRADRKWPLATGSDK